MESVVFCRPSLLQLSLYRHLLTSRAVRSCLTSFSFGGSRHLVCIGVLKKLCNDPSLIYSQCQEAKEIADSLDMDEVSIVCHFRPLSLTFGCLYCSSLKRGIKRIRCGGSFALWGRVNETHWLLSNSVEELFRDVNSLFKHVVGSLFTILCSDETTAVLHFFILGSRNGC